MRNLDPFSAIRNLKLIATALSLAVLSSCGGAGSSSDVGSSNAGSITTSGNASPGGIWTGTDSVTGLQVTGIVDEAGAFHFIEGDGTQYVGTAVTSGDALSADFDGYAPFGSQFSDGSTHGTGTLSGTVQQRVSITGTTQFFPDNGNSTTGTLSLTFSPLYDIASSLATISGNYTDPDSGDVISVNGEGGMSWVDSASSCVGTGLITIINATYNVYQVQFSYNSCVGEASVLNGVQFSGLATLDNSVSPELVLVGVTAKAGGVNYAIVLTMDRN